jgi:ribbon-helix-helix CopG family protein
MKITVALSDDLMQAIEKEARQSGQTPDQVIERVLRAALLEKPELAFKWVTVAGELQPGVDLDSRDALYELMEGRESPRE